MNNYLSEYIDKSILITGGVGCIGSNLTKAHQDKSTLRRALVEKVRQVLGYELETQIKDGVKRTLDLITENRSKIKDSARF